MKLLILIIILAIPSKVLANSLYVGTSIIHIKSNNKSYKAVNKYEAIKNPSQNIRSVVIGYSMTLKKNLVVNLSSNRFLSKEITTTVTSSSTELTYKRKLTIDTLQIGKRYNYIVPAILISNARLNSKFYYNGTYKGGEIRHDILYGFSLTAILSKELSIISFYILPNNDLSVQYALGLGLNVSF